MNQPNTGSSSRGSSATTIIAALVVVVIAVAGVAFLLLSGDDGGDDEDTGSRFDVVDARSVDGSLADLPDAERERIDPVLGPVDAPVTIIEYGAYG